VRNGPVPARFRCAVRLDRLRNSTVARILTSASAQRFRSHTRRSSVTGHTARPCAALIPSSHEIARRIQSCSEATVRRLLSILHAPAADLAAARRGKISTNKLLRRAKDGVSRRAAQRRQAAKRDQQFAIQTAADSICEWIAQEKVSGPDGERIIDDVRREFALRQQDGSLPNHNFPKLPLQELIRRCRSKRTHEGNADSDNWYHEWLFRWTFYAFPDSAVRDSALELALERQWKR
jgi:hypothetical protein